MEMFFCVLFHLVHKRIVDFAQKVTALIAVTCRFLRNTDYYQSISPLNKRVYNTIPLDNYVEKYRICPFVLISSSLTITKYIYISLSAYIVQMGGGSRCTLYNLNLMHLTKEDKNICR